MPFSHKFRTPKSPHKGSFHNYINEGYMIVMLAHHVVITVIARFQLQNVNFLRASNCTM